MSTPTKVEEMREALAQLTPAQNMGVYGPVVRLLMSLPHESWWDGEATVEWVLETVIPQVRAEVTPGGGRL
jgi:hypothetical protein